MNYFEVLTDDVYAMPEDEVYQHLAVYRGLEGWRGQDDEAYSKLIELRYGDHLDQEYDL